LGKDDAMMIAEWVMTAMVKMNAKKARFILIFLNIIEHLISKFEAEAA
jgi:hypothetical protein